LRRLLLRKKPTKKPPLHGRRKEKDTHIPSSMKGLAVEALKLSNEFE
jgi:hypothetical protein